MTIAIWQLYVQSKTLFKEFKDQHRNGFKMTSFGRYNDVTATSCVIIPCYLPIPHRHYTMSISIFPPFYFSKNNPIIPIEHHLRITGITSAGIIPCTGSVNGRRRYIVTSSLIGWAHTRHDPCFAAGMKVYELILWCGIQLSAYLLVWSLDSILWEVGGSNPLRT